MRPVEPRNTTTKALTRKSMVTPWGGGGTEVHTPASTGVNKTFVQVSGTDAGLAAKFPLPKLPRTDRPRVRRLFQVDQEP